MLATSVHVGQSVFIDWQIFLIFGSDFFLVEDHLETLLSRKTPKAFSLSVDVVVGSSFEEVQCKDAYDSTAKTALTDKNRQAFL